MTVRESDGHILPLPPGDQSGSEKPGNAGAGKVARTSRDPDRAPAVLSDGTTVLTRLDGSITVGVGVLSHASLYFALCTPPHCNPTFACDLPAVTVLPSEIWEPDAGKRHVRI
jgi:hypothetical protein